MTTRARGGNSRAFFVVGVCPSTWLLRHLLRQADRRRRTASVRVRVATDVLTQFDPCSHAGLLAEPLGRLVELLVLLRRRGRADRHVVPGVTVLVGVSVGGRHARFLRQRVLRGRALEEVDVLAGSDVMERHDDGAHVVGRCWCDGQRGQQDPGGRPAMATASPGMRPCAAPGVRARYSASV